MYTFKPSARTKKFSGVTYTLVDMVKGKKGKDKIVKELKDKGYKVRTIDTSGYGDKGLSFSVWKSK
jgi:hypothetical protein